MLVPAGASAEPPCTDTWTGPAEGEWSTVADWSAGHVPGSTDVACIGSGKTVVVSGGSAEAAVVQGEGALKVSGGSLEVLSSLESSRIATLTQSGGTLAGAATVNVSGSVSWSGGTMSGAGSTVVLSGASATLSGASNKFLAGRSLVNEGTLTFSGGQWWASSGALIKNSGTFNANSESGIMTGGGSEPSFVNTGTLAKTEGSWTTAIGPDLENSGTINVVSGSFGFYRTLVLSSGSTLEGSILLEGATVTSGSINAPKATITLSRGTFSVSSGSTATVGTLTTDGTIAGAGMLDISGSLTWASGAMTGSGTTVVLPGASGVFKSSSSFFLQGTRTFRNEGTVTFSEGQLWMYEATRLSNTGTFKANVESAAIVAPSGSAPLIVNAGTFEKTEGTGTTEVEPNFENLGILRAETGKLKISHPISVEPATQYGGGKNQSVLGHPESKCGDPVSCATGNFSETQTDFAVGGRGVGLNLTRTYNSQAGAEGVKGAFGYGWSGSFSDHLVVNKTSKVTTLYQANGSTVPFTEETGGSFKAPVWTQDTLSGTEGTGYTLTLANQTKFKFAGATGRLESVTDRNGNATTLAYEAKGHIETITDPASRKITFAYNAEGLVESAKDPMGHVVKYTYEGGNLKSVTEPGEVSARWQFKYDGSHEITEMIDGRAGKTINEYNASHQVSSQKDPMERTLTFEYEPFHTKITNKATGSVTDEHFTSNDEPVSITHGYGTASATTQSFTYNAAGLPLSVTDGNEHTTTYEYGGSGNRIKMIDANKNETKWTYDGTYDVETMTTPKGETTTIKRDSHGNAESVSRPAPKEATQTTKYTYDSHGDVESMTDPLGRTWKYEYDGSGDRTAEIDPEGDKHTWAYDEDSRVISTVSPRGNASGSEPAAFTTMFDRDAQGRVVTVADPEIIAASKPVNRTSSSISGITQEGQTLSAGVGIWEGTPTLAYTYQWQHCNTSGGSCSGISGATNSTYLLTSGDVGDTMRVVVTATNSAGSASSTSEATAVVSAEMPVYSSKFGSGGSGGGQFNGPQYDAIDNYGNVWVTDRYNMRVEEFSSSGTFMLAVGWGVKDGKGEAETCTSSCQKGISGLGNGQFEAPLGIAVNQSTGNVYVVDYHAMRVEELSSAGVFVASFGSKGGGAGQFNSPEGLTIDSSGNVWVSDTSGNRIEEFSSSGTFMLGIGWGVKDGKAEAETCTTSCQAGIAGSGNGQLDDPVGTAFSGGNVYVTDWYNNRVEEFSSTGAYLSKFGSKGSGIGQFSSPYGIAADPTNGDLYVADTNNDRVQKFTATGTFLAEFGSLGSGNGQLNLPIGLTVNSSGSVYVVDYGNNRIEDWVPASAPSNIAPPSISGELIDGQTLSASSGTWSAAPAPTYNYQWQHCNPSGGSCVAIAGATSATYVLTDNDLGLSLRVVVTATNSAGSVESSSAATGVLAKARIAKYTYDANGNLETLTDPNGNKSKTTYNADNEPTKITEPNGTVTETGYDGAGRVTSQTDGNKHETKYVRNILGEVTEVIDPLGRKTVKGYDNAGNLKTLTDPAKRTTTYTYDPANHLTEISYSDGKTHAVKYEYDSDVDRTKMTDGTGTTTYGYDQLDRLTESKDGHGDTTSYEYDLANEQTKITYPNGKSVTQAYDKAGRLEKVTDWLEHTTKFAYDPDSNLTTITFPAGTNNTDTYSYNEVDQMSEAKMAKGTETLALLNYTRDSDGQVTKAVTKGLPGTESTEYVYDENDRLTKAGTTPYEYDPADNPTKTGSSTNAYDNADQLKTSTGLTYTYDEQGERTKTTPTTGPATTYGYDQVGNLTSIERPKEGETTEIKDTYAYDGNGLRASQTISSTTSYLTWNMTEGLPLILNDGTNSYIDGPGGLAVEQVSSAGTVTYLHHDQQGSTRLLTGSTGTVTGSTTFDAYGNKTGSTGTSTTPLGYDGQYTSSDTGLIYLRARVYDPATAQFITRDPWVALTGEPYTYTGDDPTTLADPSGLLFGIPGTPSVSQVGNFVENNWRPIASAAAGVATIVVCVVPGVDVGCPAAIGANAFAQSALVATGPGSTATKVGLIAGNVVLSGGGVLGLAATEAQESLVAANEAYTAPGWVTPFLAGTSAAPSLAYEAAQLYAYPWTLGCGE